jgi:glycosyltransferase involved in cell wall biosynthesis
MRTSVIINNFNYARFVGNAIDSAREQTWPDVEVIVVDDGSTDGSQEQIARHADDVITVFKENGGQASCFNVGFAASTGDIIIFLDADDMLLPTAVERIADCFATTTPAKVHWPLWEIDADGSYTSRLRPEALPPRGDLLERTVQLGPRNHTNPPTSGNAWARGTLSHLLPMPEHEYAICADAYLVALAPLYGRLERLVEPQSLWRRHEENKFNSAAMSLERRLVDELWRYDLVATALAERLRERGHLIDQAIWKARNQGSKRLDRIDSAIREIRRLVPEGASYILADDGDWTDNSNWAGSEIVDGRRALPFVPPGPESRAPQSGVEAIERLEELRKAGATHAFFAWPAMWWLDHHSDLAAHLDQAADLVIGRGNLKAFELGPDARERNLVQRRKGHAAQVEQLTRRRRELIARKRHVDGEIVEIRGALARALENGGATTNSRADGAAHGDGNRG